MAQDMIRTGYINFDRRFGGFNRRELTAIASRPGMGKTAYILNLAVNMAKSNQKIAVFHLGENKETTLDKIACIIGDINYCNYLYGNISQEDTSKFIKARDYFVKRRLNADWIYIDEVACTMSEIILSCAERKTKYGLDAVFIDDLYDLHYFCEGGIGECVRLLKALAEKLDVAVITTVQLMRSLSDSPSLHQIREKSVLKTAQKILLLNRLDILSNSSFVSEGDLARRDVEVSVSNRHGGLSGIYRFYFNPRTLLFFEENQDYPDIEEIPEYYCS